MKLHSTPITCVLAALAALLVAGCATVSKDPRAIAQLQSTASNSATGSVSFVQNGDTVLVSGEVSGLQPNSVHGFHIHERGDCSSGDGASAGGHFNPDGQPHGNHADMAHHVGDLPSLKADANGVARFSFESPTLAVGGGKRDIMGRALMVDRDPDDYTSQPTGNSGPALACAVITRN